MTNFILGMLLMWFVVSLVIVLGDEFFGQSCCHWSDWFGFVVCFPVLIFIYPVGLVIRVIKNQKGENK